MNFNELKNKISFNREQQIGIFVLFVIIISLQMAYFFMDFTPILKENPDKQKWIFEQLKIDQQKKQIPQRKIYPFNPNFLTDYKAYKLGLSVEEADKLFRFRDENKYVNSANEFQAVTGISDSLLEKIAPYFKFSNFKTYSNNFENINTQPQKKEIVVKDINLTTKEDLIKINGIGEGISARILTQRDRIGAFVSMDQMNDIWGLSSDLVQKLKEHFLVKDISGVKKIAINAASIKELSGFMYFNYALAKEIVIYRSMEGEIKSEEDLLKIKNFPQEKASIISRYLIF